MPDLTLSEDFNNFIISNFLPELRTYTAVKVINISVKREDAFQVLAVSSKSRKLGLNGIRLLGPF